MGLELEVLSEKWLAPNDAERDLKQSRTHPILSTYHHQLLPKAIDTMSAPMQVLRQARLAQAPKLNVQRRFLNMQPTRRAMRPVPVSNNDNSTATLRSSMQACDC